MKDSLCSAASYGAAVKDAQASLQTERRPNRVFDGMYKLRSVSQDSYNAKYIVRADKMKSYGFDWLVPDA